VHLELGSIVGIGVGSLASLTDVAPLNEDDTPLASVDLLCCVGLEFLASRRHRRLPFKRSASIPKGNWSF